MTKVLEAIVLVLASLAVVVALALTVLACLLWLCFKAAIAQDDVVAHPGEGRQLDKLELQQPAFAMGPVISAARHETVIPRSLFSPRDRQVLEEAERDFITSQDDGA